MSTSSSTPVPTGLQKQWLQTRRGAPRDVLRFSSEGAIPSVAQPDEVLVKVHSVALNPVGYKMMAMQPGFMRKLPAIPEYDLAGIVVASNSPKFKEGQEVFGIVPADHAIKTGLGVMTQYCIVKEMCLALKPEKLSWEEAAGMSLTGLTALEALTTKGGLKEGERVFINGGSSAVGRMAIQIAKILGAHVVTSCSGSSAEGVKALGPDEIIDYTTTPLAPHLSANYTPSGPNPPFHLIVDCIGSQPLYVSSHTYLLPFRKYIVVGMDPGSGILGVARTGWDLVANLYWPRWLGGSLRQWVFFLMSVKEGELDKLAAWAKEGRLKPTVDSVWGFDEEGVLGAYDKLMSHKAKGKVVISVPQD